MKYKRGNLLTLTEVAEHARTNKRVWVVYAEPNPMDKHHGDKGVASIWNLSSEVITFAKLGGQTPCLRDDLEDFAFPKWRWADTEDAVFTDDDGNTVTVYGAIPVPVKPKNINHTKVLTEVVKLMRRLGVKVESLYDFENWVEDHASHTDLFKTKLF